MTINPLTVVCPECRAAVGAKCTRKVTDGFKIIEQFHQARVDAILHAPAISRDSHEHSPGDEPNMYRCTVCGKIRLTVQAFRQSGEVLQESTAWVDAEHEAGAVDAILRFLRIDFRYRFLGRNGIALPSDPNDYLIYRG